MLSKKRQIADRKSRHRGEVASDRNSRATSWRTRTSEGYCEMPQASLLSALQRSKAIMQAPSRSKCISSSIASPLLLYGCDALTLLTLPVSWLALRSLRQLGVFDGFSGLSSIVFLSVGFRCAGVSSVLKIPACDGVLPRRTLETEDGLWIRSRLHVGSVLADLRIQIWMLTLWVRLARHSWFPARKIFPSNPRRGCQCAPLQSNMYYHILTCPAEP